MDQKYGVLKLDNQLCFPLYVCSKEIVKKYKPFLDEIGLTYTQYITMKAVEIPFKMQGCITIDEKDAEDLYRILHKIMGSINSVNK